MPREALLTEQSKIHCPIAGKEVTVIIAHAYHHYRNGDMTGDVAPSDRRYEEPLRPQNAERCSMCNNCINQ